MVQYCVVCARGADRVWNTQVVVGGTPYVGCDFHSLAEVLTAAQNLTKTPGPDDTNQDPSVDESQGT